MSFSGPESFRGFRETGLSPVSRDPGIAANRAQIFHLIAFAGPARLSSPSSHQNQARSGLPGSSHMPSSGLARLM